MSEQESKYVSSSGPVNLRTASCTPGREPINPVVLERMAAAQARARLGRPLAEQLHERASTGARPVAPRALAAMLAATACGVVTLVALIQGAALLSAAGTTGGLVAGALAWRFQRTANEPRTAAPPLFDKSSLQALDHLQAGMVMEVPERIAAQLARFNQTIVRIAAGASGVDDVFTMEDRLYVTQAVRRYLPDSLQGYLAVPREQRGFQLVQGNRSPDDMLESQLALLCAELEARERKVARSAAESLVRHQRFLDHKKTS